MTVTFVDTGVLIAASRGKGDMALRALTLLDDPGRSFASSIFVRLEALPMPTYHRREQETAFFEAFFGGVEHWPASDALVIERAFEEASAAGLAALDALHVAAACLIGAETLVTTEKRSKALHRVESIRVESI
jgi:predicted nucleic acid-binding protein